jgi:hypothetical protein
MDQLIKKIIEKVVQIAHDVYNMNKSEYTLMDESGYFPNYGKITAKEISEVLNDYPHLIDFWGKLSADDRSSNKWQFSRGEDGYVVWHWPEGEEFKEVFTADKMYACSVYIKNKMEHARILFKK